MRSEWDGLISELESKEEDFVEAYSMMNTREKNRFIKFLRGLGLGCDEYITLNEPLWAAATARKRIMNKARKNNQKRIKEISKGTGFARKSRKKA
jgi:hypothetical protein